MPIRNNSIYSLQFILISLSSFLFSASFTMMLPELPAYLDKMGGEDYKGLIIALFTLTAGISRPFSGKLTDKIGRIPIMAFGSLVCFLCGILYPILITVWGFLILRLIHGFSTGFKPTGTSAYVADIIPQERRGEAMGIQAISGSLGMAIGPLMGSWLTDFYNINIMFYCSSVFALMSILILMGMKESLTDKQKFKFNYLKLEKNEWFENSVFGPFIIMLLVSFPTGAILTIAPDLCTHLKLENKGLFIAVYTISSLFIRLFAGKISDRRGRKPVMIFSSIVLAISMIIIGLSQNYITLIIGAVIFGISWGINTPTLMAWTIDISSSEKRGKAVATSYIGLEFGIGLGAVISAYIYNNNYSNFAITFFLSSFISLMAVFYLAYFKIKKPAF